MELKKQKIFKANSSIPTLNSKNTFSIQTITKFTGDESSIISNQFKSKNTDKVNGIRQSHQKLNSPLIKNRRKDNNNDKIIKTIDNENTKKIFNKKELQKKENTKKLIKKNKFIRTFSGCGHKRKCSLNNKGTFNICNKKRIVIRNNSKEKENYCIGNSLLSNDIEVIQEFNNTNSNINNYSYKKNNKFNTIMTMTNYQQKEREKYIKKLYKDQVKPDKKPEISKKDSKQKTVKPSHTIKYKEDIYINNNKNDTQKNQTKKIKELDKYPTQKIIDHNYISKNSYNSINDNNNNLNEKKIIKIHIIDSFKQKNKNKVDNIINKEDNEEDNLKKINNSVDNKNDKTEAMNTRINSKDVLNNYYSYDQMSDSMNINSDKRVFKINNCLKKSIKSEVDLKQEEMSNSNNNKIILNNAKKLDLNSKKKKQNNNNNNIKEIKIHKHTNTNSMKKGAYNLRTISSNQNLKNSNNSYNRFIKINKYNNLTKNNYTTMTNRIKLALNIINHKNNFINTKYSLIRNIKNQLAEDNNYNNNNLLFILNIISNWGNKKQIGITAIEIFDINNQKVKIKECKVEGGNNENIKRLFNDKIYTINENDMWLTDINGINNNKNTLSIKLYFYITNYINLESINNINIWNYNGWELNKSIKKIEILTKDEDIIYQGIVPKGEYNIRCFHPYKIKINKKILLKKYKNKIYKNTHLLYNTFKYDIDSPFDLNYLCCNSLIDKKTKLKLKTDIKSAYFTLIKQSSLSNTRKVNRLNYIQVKSSRSCKKNKNNYHSFVNNEFKRNKNYSESKNKKFIINKIKLVGKLKNNSFILHKNQNKNNNFEKTIKENAREYSTSTIKIEKNNSLNNIKSFDSFNIHNLNNYKTISESYNNYSKKRNSNFSITNKIPSLNIKQSKSRLKYIYFKKIRINILSNYGNSYVVGLTGLNLIDKDNKIIDIESAETVGAWPKDLKNIYFNQNEDRIFENLFNGINNTINENLMWLTLINPKPFIEICFANEMTLSRIEIWNFNEPISLDKGVKDIEIIFDDNENKKYNIILWKGLGIDYYDYYQKINFDKYDISKINYIKINNINNKYKKMPTGFIFKIIFISTFGDKDIISLKKFELYNEKNMLLTNYIVIHDNYNENYSMNNSLNNILKNNKNEYIKNYFYYHKFFDFRKDEESICNNLLFICFEEIVQIKYIKIENISNGKLKDTSTKNIQIYCDDILIFEGELRQKGENIILFDEKEIKKFNNVININKKNEKNKFVEKIKGDVYRLVNVG